MGEERNKVHFNVVNRLLLVRIIILNHAVIIQLSTRHKSPTENGRFQVSDLVSDFTVSLRCIKIILNSYWRSNSRSKHKKQGNIYFVSQRNRPRRHYRPLHCRHQHRSSFFRVINKFVDGKFMLKINDI
jgi:hypothetical protein